MTALRLRAVRRRSRSPALARALRIVLCATLLPAAAASGDSLGAVLEEFRIAHGVPGIAAALVLDDGRIVAAAAGLADRETGRPMTPETPMLAASIAKTFVAAAVLSLEAAGLLDVDARLADYLGGEPWFPGLPNAGHITLRHLLTHRSGLPDHVADAGFASAFAVRAAADSPPFTAEQLVAFVVGDEPLFEAGAGWSYSDTGYVLLGLVMESVTGERWYRVVEERLLTPLELIHTRPSNGKALPGLAAGYTAPDNPFGLPVKSVDAAGRMVWNPAVEHAGGGFVSTAVDLARWGHALFRGSALSPAVRARMLESYPRSTATPDRRYGAGVSVDTASPFGPVYGHAGWIPGYVSSLRHYPRAGVTVAFQINSDVGLADGADSPVAELERRLLRSALVLSPAPAPS